MITLSTLIAEPEPIEIDPARSAVIVVDMQNAFVSKGGMFEARGFDIRSIQSVIEPIRAICDKARERKV
ncbi:MAG TPA: pyrimidine utilization protein B, partial [Thermodesulfobacteriota bacterium]|nr:pyrimidine utilization protein B [Thermodesulfobacteriota bacterium]